MSKHSYNNYNLYTMIDDFERLTFEQAKQMYILYVNEVDIEKKKGLRTRIIQGTLHNVLEFIQNNQFDLLHCSSYDMDDVINTAFEVWIRRVDEGVLLNTNFLSQIFGREFYYDMGKILVNDRYDINAHLKMTYLKFIELLSEFIHKRNQDDNFHYQKFIKWIQENNEYQYLLEEDNMMTVNIYILLDEIYQSFQKDDVDISKTKIIFLFRLFVQNGLEHMRANIYDGKIDSFEDEVLVEEMHHNFLDVVFNECGLNEIQKRVLKDRFGIDNREEKTLEKLGKELNLSGTRIGSIEARAIQRLRKNRKRLSHFKD